MDIDDPGDLTLEVFLTWRVDSLKLFLEKRGLGKDGSKAELAALCYSANKLKLPLKITSEEAIKQNSLSYKALLSCSSTTYTCEHFSIPDPYTVNNGWCDEKEGISHWPPIYLSDITIFLSRNSSSHTCNYLSEYKSGKAYQYFSNNWLKEVFFHPLSTNHCCILRAQCSPSQRLNDTDHCVWVCVHKESGKVMSAYCSCAAG